MLPLQRSSKSKNWFDQVFWGLFILIFLLMAQPFLNCNEHKFLARFRREPCTILTVDIPLRYTNMDHRRSTLQEVGCSENTLRDISASRGYSYMLSKRCNSASPRHSHTRWLQNILKMWSQSLSRASWRLFFRFWARSADPEAHGASSATKSMHHPCFPLIRQLCKSAGAQCGLFWSVKGWGKWYERKKGSTQP